MKNAPQKFIKSRLKDGVSLFALTGMLVGMPAMAQNAAQDDDTSGIETIYVTATKRVVDIQNVAQSITAFSTADIERRGIVDMETAVMALPSISLTTRKPGLNEIVFRGISTGEGDNLKDSQVSVYLDDQPMTSNINQISPRMVDIERIEALPGPQGTLFGSSSQTGTLRIITNKPSFDRFSGQANIEGKTTRGGEFGYDFSGHINVPLVDDKLAIRIVGYKVKDGGYIDNVFSKTAHNYGTSYRSTGLIPNPDEIGTKDNAGFVEDNYNDYTVEGGRLSVLWALSEDWDLFGTLMGQKSRAEGLWGSNTALGDYKIARFEDEWRTDNWWTASLTLKGDLGWAELSNNFSYLDREAFYHEDNQMYEASHTAGGRAGSIGYNAANPGALDYNIYDLYDTGFNGSSWQSLKPSDRISNEIRLTSKNDGSRMDWMIGAFYEKSTDGWDNHAVIPNFADTKSWAYALQVSDQFAGHENIQNPLIMTSDTDYKTGDFWYQNLFERDITQVAVFGEFGYQLTDKWHAQIGYRWFQYTRDSVTSDHFPPGLPVLSGTSKIAGFVDAGAYQVVTGTDQDQSFKFTTQYNIDDDRMVYFTFSQGFRLGGENSSRVVLTGNYPPSFGPDKLNNFEFGIKSQWLENRLQINASVFYMKWNDIQVTIRHPDYWYLDGQDNAEGGRNLGAELDFTFIATENLKLFGSGYIGNPYYTGEYRNVNGSIMMSAGTPMPNASKGKFTLGADYTIQNVFGDMDMYARVDVAYRGPLYSSLSRATDYQEEGEAGEYNIEGHIMTNFQLGLEVDDTTTISFRVTNVFNQRANTFTDTREEARYGERWHVEDKFGPTHFLARPRTMSLRLAKKF